MSFWGRLFGTPETVGKAIDAVINTGDALVFTDEEKSRANMEWFQLKLEAAKATSGSRLARRMLAILFCGTFLFWICVAGWLTVLGAYYCETEACTHMAARDGVVDLMTSTAVGSSVVAIISWYFWAGIKRGPNG